MEPNKKYVLNLWSNGDSSVGISGSSITVDATNLFDGMNDSNELFKDFRVNLATFMKDYFDTNIVHTQTEEEYENERQRQEEAEAEAEMKTDAEFEKRREILIKDVMNAKVEEKLNRFTELGHIFKYVIFRYDKAENTFSWVAERFGWGFVFPMLSTNYVKSFKTLDGAKKNFINNHLSNRWSFEFNSLKNEVK